MCIFLWKKMQNFILILLKLVPGCDNKITYDMRELGYTCRNPGKKVITIHFHPTNFRTYSPKDDRVPGPYLLIAPVDNFNGEPVYIDIDGFDEQGRPYKKVVQ
jgi:hypothetical protein